MTALRVLASLYLLGIGWCGWTLLFSAPWNSTRNDRLIGIGSVGGAVLCAVLIWGSR